MLRFVDKDQERILKKHWPHHRGIAIYCERTKWNIKNSSIETGIVHTLFENEIMHMLHGSKNSNKNFKPLYSI